MTTISEMCSEVSRELIMRKKVWNTVPGSHCSQFINFDHQKYYDHMAAVLELLKALTPAEFKTIQDRIRRTETELKNQTKLDF